MVSAMVDVPQTSGHLVLDMPLEVAFEQLGDGVAVPVFRPTEPAA
jgi:hypothetical protein